MFRELSRFKPVVGPGSGRLNEGAFFFFFLLGEATLSGVRGGSCVEGAGDRGGVATTPGRGGDTASMILCPSLSTGAAADFFFFGFFFFFFFGAVDRPSSSSSSASSTVVLVDRWAGAGATG